MALFTTTDRDNVKTALIMAATEGVASVAISGQSVQTYSLDQLTKLLAVIQADIAGDNTSGNGGLRQRKVVPGGCG